MKLPDYYTLLELERGASQKEIMAAHQAFYQQLNAQMSSNPLKKNPNHESTIYLNDLATYGEQAWNVLSNPASRKKYDAILDQVKDPQIIYYTDSEQALNLRAGVNYFIFSEVDKINVASIGMDTVVTCQSEKPDSLLHIDAALNYRQIITHTNGNIKTKDITGPVTIDAKNGTVSAKKIAGTATIIAQNVVANSILGNPTIKAASTVLKNSFKQGDSFSTNAPKGITEKGSGFEKYKN